MRSNKNNTTMQKQHKPQQVGNGQPRKGTRPPQKAKKERKNSKTDRSEDIDPRIGRPSNSTLARYAAGRGELSQRMAAVNLSNKTSNKALTSFMNAGSEVSSKEVTLKITKYIDWLRGESDTDRVLNVTFDMEQDLLAPDGSNTLGTNAVLSRVKRCRLSSYPRSANAQNAENVYAVLTSVPVRGGGGNALLNAHQQSVVVPPTFTPKWHKVFDCDYDKLFESAQVLPENSINFPLFNTQLVDADTFDPIVDQPIQLKLEIWVTQTVPVRSQVLLGTGYQTDFVNSRSTATDQLAFVQVLGMSNRT